MDPVIFMLAPIVLVAYANEALTGFGAAVIAVTLGAHFYPLDQLVPVLVPLNVIVTGYISIRHRSHIDRDLLLKRVFPFMITGLLIGVVLFPLLRGIALKKLLGLLVVFFAGREFVLLIGKIQSRGRPLSTAKAGIIQVMAGVVHAFYATGGPLLVYSIGRLELPKKVFRPTLCAVWATLNTILVLIFVLKGRINMVSMELTALLFPLLPAGILVGEWLHDRINEHHFRLVIYGLLLFAGLTLIF
jgi:uncharacterized membrane protein YfcA